jgi:hypothetical protein
MADKKEKGPTGKPLSSWSRRGMQCGRAYYFYLFRETAGAFWRDCGKE